MVAEWKLFTFTWEITMCLNKFLRPSLILCTYIDMLVVEVANGLYFLS